jgi:hypothetical protein
MTQGIAILHPFTGVAQVKFFWVRKSKMKIFHVFPKNYQPRSTKPILVCIRSKVAITIT